VWLVHLTCGGKSRRQPVFSFQGNRFLRTRIYIDGYNLYYGCLKGTSFKWLDLLALFERQIVPSANAVVNGQRLTSEILPVAIKFFSAKILAKAAKADDSMACQERYHAALRKHHPGRVELIEGYYAMSASRARVINQQYPKKWPRDCETIDVWKLEEKQSDVNLALHAFHDTLTGEVQHAIIVTNDTDIEPALKMIRQHTGAVLGLVIPTTDCQRIPNTSLEKRAHWVRKYITAAELAASQLPRVIQGSKNPTVKPDSWYAQPALLRQSIALGIVELGSRAKVFQWLERPLPMFANMTPLEMLETEVNGNKLILFMREWAENLDAGRTKPD